MRESSPRRASLGIDLRPARIRRPRISSTPSQDRETVRMALYVWAIALLNAHHARIDTLALRAHDCPRSTRSHVSSELAG